MTCLLHDQKFPLLFNVQLSNFKCQGLYPKDVGPGAWQLQTPQMSFSFNSGGIILVSVNIPNFKISILFQMSTIIFVWIFLFDSSFYHRHSRATYKKHQTMLEPFFCWVHKYYFFDICKFKSFSTFIILFLEKLLETLKP